MMSQKITTECWCYAIKRVVRLRGVIEGKRQADLLRVKHCEIESHCQHFSHQDCLVGTLREGRWP